jgi:hypothetical protein
MSRLVYGGIVAVLLTLSEPGPSVGADRTIPGATASSPRAAPSSFVVRQRFEAEVSEVDRTARVLRLKTEAGPLRLQDPDGATTALRKGDSVVVDVALIRHSAPAGLPRRQEDPPPLLTQQLRASITGIHRTVEVVALNTPAGRLTLAVPSKAIAGLHTGDSVLLELTVRPETEPSALPATEAQRRSGLAGLLYMLFGRGK